MVKMGCKVQKENLVKMDQEEKMENQEKKDLRELKESKVFQETLESQELMGALEILENKVIQDSQGDREYLDLQDCMTQVCQRKEEEAPLANREKLACKVLKVNREDLEKKDGGV